MVAVYILLSSLLLSTAVILAIVTYCTIHCWRKRCFKARMHRRRRAAPPHIRVSTSYDTSGAALMSGLKHSRNPNATLIRSPLAVGM